MLGVTRGTIYNYIKRMKGLSKSNTGRFLLPKIPSEKKFRQFNKDCPITSEPLVAEWIEVLKTTVLISEIGSTDIPLCTKCRNN